ncbi:TlpA disulfide reductase family protein [Mucilaginibacter sp. cycad4]|uniref:TlpA family protein disulfide reductase n=1 Tax=Mucilaginibacter sp. cycad4 TaxID=3342096 RepID=UPI002AAB90E5|nr:TlpA disulfide reductase family protein [Mucilaginibacter gossypii]WPU98642.1 TlpA disulfide reductase family protein [Mucilaginibacter gossypii]
MNLKAIVYLLLLSAIAILSLSGFRPDQSKSIYSQKLKDGSKATISFSLKAHEQFMFEYTNVFLEREQIKFINPGGTDTVIIREVTTNIPVALTLSFFEFGKDKGTKEIKFSVLASPGDTLNLSLTNQISLNTTRCKKGSVLSNDSISYYTTYTLSSGGRAVLSKKELWESFYTEFNNRFQQETDRIKGLLANFQIDSLAFKQMTINCKLHYYKRLLDWLYEDKGKYFEPALPVISKLSPDIENILNDPHLFLAQDLLNVIDGYVRLRIINKGGNYVNGITIYKEASAINLGRFKPSYLSICLTHSPVKKGAEFGEIMKDYREKMANTAYLIHLDSIIRNVLDGQKIIANDMLVNLKGKKLSLNNLIKSKKQFYILDFWASWCSPCRAQLPVMDSLRSVLKRYSVEVVSVNLDEKEAYWKTASLAESKYLGINNYHLNKAAKSAIVHQLNISSIPRYVILDNFKIISSNFYQPAEPSFVEELKNLINAR